jgi:hypothetical protein
MPRFCSFRQIVILCVANMLTAHQASARVLIHFGFIDEEIGAALPELIKANKNIPTLAVSIESNQTTLLFQKPMDHYGSTSLMIPATGNVEQKSFNALVELLNSAENLKHRNEMAQQLGIPGVQVESAPSARYSIRTFNFESTSNAKDLVVAVKPPEFGRQPLLLAAHLTQILAAVEQLPQASDGILLSSLATGGAVQRNSLPASKFEVAGSLYFGIETQNGPDQSKNLRAVIRFFDPVLQSSLDLFQSSDFKSTMEAEAYLRQFLRDESRVLNLNNPAFGAFSLGQHIRRQQQKGFNFSLTLSYFGTEVEKSIARSLGLINVNMEDAHIMEAAARHTNAYRVVRVTTDPSHIPGDFIDEMYRWAKTEKYTVADYIEGILWGLKGSPLNDAPKRARWNIRVAEKLANEIFYINPELGGPLDPFFVEMSVKFIEDAANGRLIDIESISDKIVDQLSESGLEALSALVNNQSIRISQLAGEIINIQRQSGSTEKLRPYILQLVQLAAELDIPKESQLYRELLSLSAAVGERRHNLLKVHAKLQILSQSDVPASNLGEAMDIWVRNSKWRIRTNKLNYVAPRLPENLIGASAATTIHSIRLSEFADQQARQATESFASSLADRALYRSAMTPAMVDASHGFFGVISNTEKFYPIEPRSCPQLSKSPDF